MVEPKENKLTLKKLFFLMSRALNLMLRASPKWSISLLLTLLAEGLMPTLTILLTKLTVEFIQGEVNITIGLVVFFWASLLILNTILASLNQYLQGGLAEKFTSFINIQLMNKSSTVLGLELLDDSAYFNDLKVLREGASQTPLNVMVLLIFLIRDLFTVVSMMILLLTLGWWIPPLMIISAIPYAIAVFNQRQAGWHALIGRSQEAREMQYDSEIAISNKHAAEVRLYNMFPWLIERYTRKFESTHIEMNKIRMGHLIKASPASMVSSLASTSLFAISIYRASNNLMSLSELIVVLQTLNQVYRSSFGVVESIGLLLERSLYFKKYFDFISTMSKIVLSEEPKDLLEGSPSIKFSNVSFVYSKGTNGLRNVSFAILPGERVAIVGENGAGKSTLIKLLVRFYDPQSGVIEVNNIDLRDLDIYKWRQSIGAVFQDFGRYSYTVKENIIISNYSKYTNRGVDIAAKMSGVDEMVKSMANGIDTRLGREFGGIDISGGQWQKLAIARAINQKAQMYILDEPSSSLDPASEHEIFANLSRILTEKTTIFITHRLASIKMVDRVIVLKAGRIVEDGKPDELLVLNGEYARLWNMQASGYKSEGVHSEL